MAELTSANRHGRSGGGVLDRVTGAVRRSGLLTFGLASARKVSDAVALMTSPLLASRYVDLEPPAIAAAFHDDFERPDGDLDVSPSGHPWLVVPTNGAEKVVARISDGALVTSPSTVGRTAAYSAIQLSETAKSVRAEVSFSPGLSGGAAALILTKSMPSTSTVAHIVDEGSVHIVFATRKVKIGLFKGRDYFELAAIHLPKGLAMDGTCYRIGFDVSGDLLTVYAPGCAPRLFKHPRIAELAGEYVTFQIYAEARQCLARYHRVEAA